MDPISPSPPDNSSTVVLAVVASIGAGVVHATAAGTHAGDTTLVWLFALTALAQVGWGLVALRRSTRAVLVTGIVIQAVAIVAWTLSRTVGLPVVASLAEPESIGGQDLAAAVLGATALIATGIGLTSVRIARPIAAGFTALALVPALLGMVAPHAHGDHTHQSAESHEHAAGVDQHADGDDHSHDHQASGVAADPVFAGADISQASEEQLTRAKALVEDTRTAVEASFSDVASVEAAGYISIGDGRRKSGVSYEHFINPGYLTDGHQLDPTHVESLVFEVRDGHKTLTTAMYLLDRGQTMADVPDIAGDLTTWHDHQNLCWDESGTRLAGIVRNGSCTGGTLRPTPPMLHVWLADNPCGPFAGVEGHGAGTTPTCASHQH